MNIFHALGSQWVSTFIRAILSFLLSLILARLLGVKDFGTYSYILSLAYIFSILQDGGYRTTIIRELTSPTVSYSKNQVKILELALGHVIFTTFIGLMIIPILPIPYKFTVAVAVVCMGMLTVHNYISSVLRGYGNYTKDALWQVGVKIVSVVAILISLLISPNIEYIFISWSLGLTIIFFLPQAKVIWARPFFKPNKLVIKSCFAFLMIDVATVLYFRSDIILLNHFQSESS